LPDDVARLDAQAVPGNGFLLAREQEAVDKQRAEHDDGRVDQGDSG
jgi:hypothetical protein